GEGELRQLRIGPRRHARLDHGRQPISQMSDGDARVRRARQQLEWIARIAQAPLERRDRIAARERKTPAPVGVGAAFEQKRPAPLAQPSQRLDRFHAALWRDFCATACANSRMYSANEKIDMPSEM